MAPKRDLSQKSETPQLQCPGPPVPRTWTQQPPGTHLDSSFDRSSWNNNVYIVALGSPHLYLCSTCSDYSRTVSAIRKHPPCNCGLCLRRAREQTFFAWKLKLFVGAFAGFFERSVTPPEASVLARIWPEPYSRHRSIFAVPHCA